MRLQNILPKDYTAYSFCNQVKLQLNLGFSLDSLEIIKQYFKNFFVSSSIVLFTVWRILYIIVSEGEVSAMNTLGKRLMQARGNSGLTQAAVAEKLSDRLFDENRMYTHVFTHWVKK